MAKGTFVSESDLLKIKDTLDSNETFHIARDQMNAAIHLGTTRHSPITSETIAARERVDAILDKVDSRE